MIHEDIALRLLFEPLSDDVDELYIVSAYATPTMLSWYMKNLDKRTHCPIKISLMVGMIPYDGVSVSVHEGFIQLLHDSKPPEISKLECSYIYDNPAVHSNVYIWAKGGIPISAFMGSANFVQGSFVGHHRQEVISECDPAEAMRYYEELTGRSIYANHAEVEEYVLIHPTHPVLDRENALREDIGQTEHLYKSVKLSLLARNGEPGRRSGLNWGQRPNRNPNEAYIHLPRRIAKSGFFPLEERHFTAITDDRHQLILRIEQQNDKAITTPARNSDLGEYFRNRLGLANGEYVSRVALDRYGRTDVTFIKLDEETYYMDFSV